MIANIITGSRVFLSLCLFVWPPFSSAFAVMYLLCGVTDVLDGFLARKLHTESKKGAMLDSVADLVFAVIYAVRILPILSVPYWIWIWTAIIAVIKIAGILITGRKMKKLSIEHSFDNKFTGLMLFLLPISVCAVDIKYGATLVCAVATVTVIKEMVNWKQKTNENLRASK